MARSRTGAAATAAGLGDQAAAGTGQRAVGTDMRCRWAKTSGGRQPGADAGRDQDGDC